MRRVKVYGPMSTGHQAFHCHAADCHHRRYRGGLLVEFDVDAVPGSANETLEETVALEVYSDMVQPGDPDLDIYVADIKFFPCLGKSNN